MISAVKRQNNVLESAYIGEQRRDNQYRSWRFREASGKRRYLTLDLNAEKEPAIGRSEGRTSRAQGTAKAKVLAPE